MLARPAAIRVAIIATLTSMTVFFTIKTSRVVAAAVDLHAWNMTPNHELEHGDGSDQIDESEQIENELCDGSWGGCGECSNCNGEESEGYFDEENYDG
jgi:hypothetical protein